MQFKNYVARYFIKTTISAANAPEIQGVSWQF